MISWCETRPPRTATVSWTNASTASGLSPSSGATIEIRESADIGRSGAWNSPRGPLVELREQCVFDVVHAVDLGAQHRDQRRVLGAAAQQDRAAVVLLAARHDGLDLPERIDVPRRTHGGKVTHRVAHHVLETRGAARREHLDDRLIRAVVPMVVWRVPNVTQRV